MVAGLLLAGASVALPATPAAANQHSASTFWYCAVHRPPNTTVNHSWPNRLPYPGVVEAWCQAGTVQYWVWFDAEGNSTRPWDYQSCYYYPYCYGPPGH